MNIDLTLDNAEQLANWLLADIKHARALAEQTDKDVYISLRLADRQLVTSFWSEPKATG